MKKILMIGTGGTIASTHTEQGLRPGLGTEDILRYIPAVRDICQVEAIQVCSLDSTNVTPEHWKLLARTVEENYERFDGFVICHGTDPLAYTAAALSYMIRNSEKPIVITGAQKPICMDVTDARTNLLDSFIYAADDGSRNVSIVFDGKVIAGTRAKKERAKSYDAFSSINFPYLAVIQDGLLVRYIREDPCAGVPEFFYDLKDSVCVLKLVPGLRGDILPWLFEHYDCIVIESFGVGGIPQTFLPVFYEEMEKWKDRGKYVVMATQVAKEGSNMTVYEVGKQVKQDFELLEAYDMTLEAVITKMMWLMGRGVPGYARVKREFYTEINHDVLFTKRK